MAHAWWRDSDYELFYRLTAERDEARAALKSVAEAQREACALEVHRWPEARIAARATPLVTEGDK
jgi:hypothetical protein